MYNFRLTEEIARWAFEIICHENPNWYIAFTNPTAGPWKTIKGLDRNNKEGEVYRFELEETRPDIIIVNDTLKLIIVIEAKDSITKLTHKDQSYKSVQVVNTINSLLKGENAKANPFWENRAEYTILTGLLWGAESSIESSTYSKTFDEFHDNMKDFPQLYDHLIVGIETRRKDDGLQCYFCGKSYGTSAEDITLSQISDSFGILTI